MQRLRVDSQVARALNRATVFDLLRTRKVISRIALARETGFSKATISEIVDQFIREGFVRELGPGQSSGGRRPTLLEFDPRARYAIGLELGDAACSAVLTDLNAEPIQTLSRAVRAQNGDDAVSAAIQLVGELKADLPNGSLLGVGVGTPGLVDSARGVIQMAPDLGWQDVPVGPPLAEEFALPVAVVNRAKAAALGEAWCGAGRQVDNLIYVSLSTGIAAGVVIGGRLYRGVSMSEGELGHVTVVPDGPLCRCGNRGCLQALAGAEAILSRLRQRLRDGQPTLMEDLANGKLDLLTLQMVAQGAAAGDALVLSVLDEVAAYVGTAAANLINILNPRMLVLGGSIIRALPSLVPRIEAEIRRRAMAVPFSAVQIVPSQLKGNAVPVGAAAFLLSQVSVVDSPALRSPAAVVDDGAHSSTSRQVTRRGSV